MVKHHPNVTGAVEAVTIVRAVLSIAWIPQLPVPASLPGAFAPTRAVAKLARVLHMLAHDAHRVRTIPPLAT
jgi:hypothetical protein